jgi:CHAT domain-containing protein
LAAPASGSKPDEDDGLLTVREIASLRFNADWVILSACNTAAPDREESLGLSGLMSAFFSAGARAVVVSQWRLRDDVAASLVPDILGRFERDPSLDKAQALQLASLAVLDDIRKDDRAFPSEWATFSLVGDAAR